MIIQWYPGHMAKAKRIIKEDLKLVDLVLEVLDARIPYSSSNPDLKELLYNQQQIKVLNKIDLANPHITKQWLDYFQIDSEAVGVNALRGQGISSLFDLLENKSDEVNKKVLKKGRNRRALRIMVIGVTNVGKSALINTLAGSGITITGNRPGVTRGRQWINIKKDIQLLDTPGILWPKFDDEEVGYKLAITGAIDDDIFDTELAAYKLIKYVSEINISILENGYRIDITDLQPYDILAEIGKKRGCLMSGGRVNRKRAAELILNDFRNGKWEQVSLEKPSSLKEVEE